MCRIILKARLSWIRNNGFTRNTSTVLFPTRGFSSKTGAFTAPRAKRTSDWKGCESSGLTAIQATGLRTIASSAQRRNRRGAHDHPVSSPRCTRRSAFGRAASFRRRGHVWVPIISLGPKGPKRSPQRRQEGSCNGEMPTRALGRARFVSHVRSARFSSGLKTTG